MQDTQGRPLLLSEHDCCCMYQLSVHAMREGVLDTLFEHEQSTCDEDCKDRARLVFSDGKLVGVDVPNEECGGKPTRIDATTW